MKKFTYFIVIASLAFGLFGCKKDNRDSEPHDMPPEDLCIYKLNEKAENWNTGDYVMIVSSEIYKENNEYFVVFGVETNIAGEEFFNEDNNTCIFLDKESKVFQLMPKAWDSSSSSMTYQLDLPEEQDFSYILNYKVSPYSSNSEPRSKGYFFLNYSKIRNGGYVTFAIEIPIIEKTSE